MAFRTNARRAILARFYKSTSATPPLYHTQAAYSLKIPLPAGLHFQLYPVHKHTNGTML